MASYNELFDLRRASSSNSAFLRNRIGVAATVKAQALMVGAAPTSDAIKWAASVLADPLLMAELIYNYLLADNQAATVAQILAATDAAIQTQVNIAADALIAGGAV